MTVLDGVDCSPQSMALLRSTSFIAFKARCPFGQHLAHKPCDQAALNPEPSIGNGARAPEHVKQPSPTGSLKSTKHAPLAAGMEQPISNLPTNSAEKVSQTIDHRSSAVGRCGVSGVVDRDPLLPTMERCASPSPPRQHRRINRANPGPELQFPKRMELRSRAPGTTYSPTIGKFDKNNSAASDNAGEWEVVGEGENKRVPSQVHAAGCEDERNTRTTIFNTSGIAGNTINSSRGRLQPTAKCVQDIAVNNGKIYTTRNIFVSQKILE